MPLNRAIAPPLQAIEALRITDPEQYHLSNGIPVYLFNMGEQEVVELRLVFEAGRYFETQKLQAAFTNRMLREGTIKYAADQIADRIEHYGAIVRYRCSSYHSSITLSTVARHLPALLPTLMSIIREANFPQERLDTVLQNSKQKLLLNKQRNEYIAEEAFNKLILGNDSHLAYSSEVKYYDALTTDALRAFYQQHYSPSNCRLFIAGKVSEAHQQLIEQHLSDPTWAAVTHNASSTFEPFQHQPQQLRIPKEGSVQAAVRIGCPLFNKTHPDYAGLFMLNTIYGGYFGSRLNVNLREEKGLTYSIYSAMVSMVKGGYFYISTDVRVDAWKQVVDEIYREMERLHEELIPEEELLTARNYLMGVLLGYFDGAFNTASTLQGAYLYDLDAAHYHHIANTIRTITPIELRDLARKYLVKEKMSEVVAGGNA